MKRLFLTVMVVSIFGLVVNAQEKFDKTEEEQNVVPDSAVIEEEYDKQTNDDEKGSTKIEVDVDWDNWDEDWNKWREKRKEDWKSSKKRGFFRGGAGGWDYYMMELKVDNINAKLVEIGLDPFDKNIFLSGGGGWGFIGHGIRVGGIGAGGKVVSRGTPFGGNDTKEVIMSIGFGGFTIEKVFHPFNRSEIYLGTMIGGGNMNIEFSQWSENSTWNHLWSGYDSTYTDGYRTYQNEIKTNYFTLLPTIGVRYNIFRWAAVGLNVGYVYTHESQDGWKMNGRTVTGIPDIDFSNVIYRFNIYFGG